MALCSYHPSHGMGALGKLFWDWNWDVVAESHLPLEKEKPRSFSKEGMVRDAGAGNHSTSAAGVHALMQPSRRCCSAAFCALKAVGYGASCFGEEV